MAGERRLEAAQLSPLCAGRVYSPALEELSLLARPGNVERPTAEQMAEHRAAHPGSLLVAPGVRRLDARLLERLAAIAARFPNRELQIVSGYRPGARRTSRHRHARALDLRVVGVDREEVATFARTLPGTGVGYYPNSTFTHIDVREASTSWVDRSGPGQRADYAPWPAGDDTEPTRARRTILSAARDAIGAIARAAETSLVEVAGEVGEAAREQPTPPESDVDTEELEPMSAEELARLRADWRAAIGELAPD